MSITEGVQTPIVLFNTQYKRQYKSNEEQIITVYPINGAMGSSGGGRVPKLSMVCSQNNVAYFTSPPRLNSDWAYVHSMLKRETVFAKIRAKTYRKTGILNRKIGSL